MQTVKVDELPGTLQINDKVSISMSTDPDDDLCSVVVWDLDDESYVRIILGSYDDARALLTALGYRSEMEVFQWEIIDNRRYLAWGETLVRTEYIRLEAADV